jgi:hypothetical protein
MDASLIVDLMLKATIAALALGVAWFFGSMFGLLAYVTVFPPTAG